MANLTQAIAQRPPATMHVSQPVVNVTNVATRTTALLTQHPVIPHQPSTPPKLPVPPMKVMAKGDVSKLPAPQVHLEPFSKIQASTVTTVSCGKSSIQPTNPGSSANMSLSSAIALESAQKSLAAAKTTGPRLVMHTQEQAQAAVKAMLDKKALTKTNSPVLIPTRQPPSSIPDLATEVLHKAVNASPKNKTNSPRTESQAVVTTGTGKQVTQPQTILGTVQSVNAATRAALTPNSGSHSHNATPHTPPSPPQNLALQPMTQATTGSNAPQPGKMISRTTAYFEQHTKAEIIRDFIQDRAAGIKIKADDVSHAVQSKKVTFEECVANKIINEKQAEILRKALLDTPTSQAKKDEDSPYDKYSREQILSGFQEIQRKGLEIGPEHYFTALITKKVTLKDMVDAGIINENQAITLRNAFQNTEARCEFTPTVQPSTLLASSSSAVNTTRTSAGTVVSQDEALQLTTADSDEFNEVIYSNELNKYYGTAISIKRFLKSLPPSFSFHNNEKFVVFLHSSDYALFKKGTASVENKKIIKV